MIKNNDIDTLRKSIAEKQGEKTELIRQVQIERNNLAALYEIIQGINDNKIIMQDNQQEFEKEQKKLKKQIEKVKKKINGYEKTEVKKEISLKQLNLTRLEVSLKVNIEKMYKIDTKLAELTEDCKDKIYSIQQLDSQISELEEKTSVYDKYRKSINRIQNLNMFINDLEGQIPTIENSIIETRKMEEHLNVTLDELLTQHVILQQQINDFEQDSSAPLTSIFPDLFSLKMTELKHIIADANDVHCQNTRAMNELSEIRRKINEDDENFNHQKSNILESIQKVEEESKSISSQIENFQSVFKRQVIKTKQLQKELSFQVKEMRNRIMNSRSSDPSVISISQNLEIEWENHQKALDTYKKWQDRLERDRVILEKKINVIDELDSLSPLNSKVKIEPGVKEFMFLFDIVFTQNRDMAKDLQILMKEKEKLEMENQNLKDELNES